MHYIYLLKVNGAKNKNYYFGFTSDLKKRIEEHEKGFVKTTKNKNPELIYYEAFDNKYLALKREKGLKNSGSVYNALLKRLGLK
jgi:putative endonuclease